MLKAHTGDVERLPLDKAAQLILEECRMVLPGIQTLFGFQLIAVFSQGFSELARPAKILHFVALLLVATAIGLVMAPAALHRQSQPREVSERFIRIASNLLLSSMLPLAVAICVEAWIVSVVIIGNPYFSAVIAFLLMAMFVMLWIVLPRFEARARSRER